MLAYRPPTRLPSPSPTHSQARARCRLTRMKSSNRSFGKWYIVPPALCVLPRAGAASLRRTPRMTAGRPHGGPARARGTQFFASAREAPRQPLSARRQSPPGALQLGATARRARAGSTWRAGSRAAGNPPTRIPAGPDRAEIDPSIPPPRSHPPSPGETQRDLGNPPTPPPASPGLPRRCLTAGLPVYRRCQGTPLLRHGGGRRRPADRRGGGAARRRQRA